ncbi:DinB family protein [Bacillus oleivorans]|uniref:DinB family protein n=1 Tax=Bacillus oleivorans TaxID=1448271 RepID=UPI000BE40D1B|nr:DinB family protein [Bacillus oleivorans]
MYQRPDTDEYNQHYSNYIRLIPDGDIIEILNNQIDDTITLLQGLKEEQSLFKYGPDKWTIKEVIGHITDTERIMGYRILCIARGETISLPGYDDVAYVRNAHFNKVSITELLDHFKIVRQSTAQLVKSLESNDWLRRGIANNSNVSVRALINLVAGHELHHRKLIKERYIGSDQYPQ